MEAIIVATIGVLGVAAGAWITSRATRSKTKAEADKNAADANEQIRETVMSLIQPLKEKISELEREVRILKIENADLKTWAEALVNQLKQLGKEPVPYKCKKEHDA